MHPIYKVVICVNYFADFHIGICLEVWKHLKAHNSLTSTASPTCTSDGVVKMTICSTGARRNGGSCVFHVYHGISQTGW